MPDPRPIDLTAALLLATAALALSLAAGAAFLLVAVVAPSGDDTVALDAGWTAACAALATVALLLALTRGSVRAPALVAAAALSAAWPLCGAPLAGALIATPAIALVVRWGARPAPLSYAIPLAALCALLALTSLALAAADPQAPSERGQAPSRDSAANPQAPSERGQAPSRDSAGEPRAPSERGQAPVGVRGTVRAYYRALDRRAFGSAWRALAPAVRAGFGGFATWRAGFAQTVSSTPHDLQVGRSGRAATVTHQLEARDRAACGIAVRRFTMRWQLERTQSGWRAVALSGTAAGAPLC